MAHSDELGTRKARATDRKAAAGMLFDGKTMEGWKVTDFAGHGDARVREGARNRYGAALSGVQYTNQFKVNYKSPLSHETKGE